MGNLEVVWSGEDVTLRVHPAQLELHTLRRGSGGGVLLPRGCLHRADALASETGWSAGPGVPTAPSYDDTPSISDTGRRLPLDALGRLLAANIAEVAREVARDEGRRAALEVIDQSSSGRFSPEWVTQKKAAAIAGRTPQTIRSWLRAGHLGEPGHNGSVNVARLTAYLALANDTERDAHAGRARKIADAVLRAQR